MNNPSPTRGSSNIAWPGLVVLLGSICAYWLAQNELNTSRPEAPRSQQVPDPVGADALEAAYSRMWDDPISTTFEHYQNHPPKPATNDSETGLDPSVPEEIGKPTESPEKRIKTLFANLVHQYEGSSTLCLPILVNGGPHAEDKESRLRTRYAVVTALAHAGYKLSFPDRMSYAVVKAKVLALAEGPEWTEETFVIPVKLYRPMINPYRGNTSHSHSNVGGRTSGEQHAEGTRSQNTKPGPQILVLWINESQLGKRPLLALNRITESLFGDVEERKSEEASQSGEGNDNPILSFRIIGPTSSDTLQGIQQEMDMLYVKDPKDTDREKIDRQRLEWKTSAKSAFLKSGDYIPILSARATVSDTRNPDKDARSELESIPLFKIIRTIGNDHFLVSHALHQELAARGAWPDAGRNQMMILLTEHDTSYGRRIVNELEHVFSLSDQTDTNQKDVSQSSAQPRGKTAHADGKEGIENTPEFAKAPVRVFKYLRGIDGQTAAESAADSEPKKTNSDARDGLYGFPSNGISNRPPHGKSQYDYLRRLKQEIQHIKESKRVTAIGVVGSDVYDKLLILRALRPHFPDTVFFTTDLDAIYIHPEELHHTRNLIITSHFGLTINSQFHDLINSDSSSQFGMLPFRDSYQTSEHLATRIAIGDEGIRHALKSAMPESLKSNDVMAMAACLWDHTHQHDSHLKSGVPESKGVLQPLLTTVGNNGFRQLTIPPLSSRQSHAAEQEPEADQSRLQPVPESRIQPMRAPWILLLIAIGGGLLFLWEDRAQIRQFLRPDFGSTSSKGAAEQPSPTPVATVNSAAPASDSEEKEFLLLDQKHASEVRSWLLRFFWGVVVVGSFLVGWLMYVAFWGWEPFVMDGTSVLPRILVNILIGLITAGTLVHYTHRIMQCRLDWQVRTNPSFQASKLIDTICGADPYSPELREFCANRVCKIASLWIVCTIWCAGVLAYSIVFECITVGVILIAAVLMLPLSRWLPSYPKGPGFWGRLDRTKKVLLGGSVVALGITVIGSQFPSVLRVYPFVYGGWGPEFISRGASSRALDRAAMMFGYCMLTGLFVTVLYGQHWSREFTRHLRRLVTERFQESGPKNVDGRVESLILIGEATAVTNIYSPWLLAYLLVMVLAYHPLTSPVPVPAGLLVLLSLAILLLVVSTLYLRFVVQTYRDRILYGLRGELFEVRRMQADGGSTLPPSGSALGVPSNQPSLPVQNQPVIVTKNVTK